MKIIYLANARIPTEKAHGLQIMKMCQAFVKLGHNVKLVVAKRVNPQFKDIDPFNYYGIKESFKIKKLPLLDIVASNRSFKGLSVPIQNTSFAISLFFYLLFKKIDIIYSRDEFSIFFLSLFKKNIILELHTFPQGKLGLYKFLLKRVKKIVVITQSLKKLLTDQLGVEANKIIVSPDGVDLDQFNISASQNDCQQKLNLPLDKKIILYTGHLFAWKGVYVLAQASKFLTNDELIVIVGGMEYDQNQVKKYIQENDLKNIILIKHQAPEKIPYYLKAADAVVLPNSGKKKISKLYTSPMKLFEYMAAKKPIVASDLSSIREVLNKNNSILVEPDDPQALALGVKKVMADSESAQILVDQAYNDVQQYSWLKRATKIIEFIK